MKEAAGNFLGKVKKLCSLTAKSLLPSLTSVKVVLSWLARYELAVFGHFDSLSK